jgi:RNA polymerase sigma factor (sigma-70 family)
MPIKITNRLKDWSHFVCVAANSGASEKERHHAFGVLVHQFQDFAFGVAYATLGNTHLAEEAAQEAFIVAWNQLPTLKNPYGFPRWLRMLIRTQCSRALRRKVLSTISLENATSIIHSEDATIGLEWRSALESLPEPERLALVFFYLDGYSRKETATLLGVSEATIKKRLTLARAKLHVLLKENWQENMSEELNKLSEAKPSQSPEFKQQLEAFTRLFNTLIQEGISLLRCLERLESDAKIDNNTSFATVIGAIKEKIATGHILSVSMAEHPAYFPLRYTQAIREGEITGLLDIALERLVQGTYEPGCLAE